MRVEANLPMTLLPVQLLLQQMHNKKMFDLEKEGQIYGVQYSPLRHSVTNINLYKGHI